MTRTVDVAPLHSLSAGERSRSWQRRLRLREWLARSLVVVPCMYIVAAVALAVAMPTIEGEQHTLGLDADTARTILSTVAGGMIAFTGLVVSLAVVVVQFGAGQYTPRLVQRFRRDRMVKHALGIFIAPAVYALRSLWTVGVDGDDDAVPGITVGLSIIFLTAAVIVFFLLVAHLLDLLRPRRVIAQLVEQGIAAIDDVYPFPFGQTPAIAAPPPAPVVDELRHAGPPAILKAIDRARLLRAAAAADALVVFDVAVGDYLPPGVRVLQVYGGADAVDRRELRRALLLGDERTIAQDPAYAVRAIVDLALRALSPAINDPSTAVQALDGLESLLLVLAERDLQRGRLADAGGNLRLVYPTPSWADLLDLAVGEIRHYGADAPQVVTRLDTLLGRLGRATPPAYGSAIRDQLARMGAGSGLPPDRDGASPLHCRPASA